MALPAFRQLAESISLLDPPAGGQRICLRGLQSQALHAASSRQLRHIFAVAYALGYDGLRFESRGEVRTDIQNHLGSFATSSPSPTVLATMGFVSKAGEKSGLEMKEISELKRVSSYTLTSAHVCVNFLRAAMVVSYIQ